ncbi:hypothetical protein GPECTOR_8g402 [Gonium pectorale]|uniref:Protein kinase domain-containing protein n=1 Tax=Gonium pectorale TaxID=33097 RepID=A0A150GT56_GONPE|nr:hypothetical protein GPECTOR_8g402 [Gonium pectorale]|eukprot:KXZ53037.1 hypothetical protein GPECTOR_8g402 [Gonium pectorale]
MAAEGGASCPTDLRVRQAVAEAAISVSVSHPNVVTTYTYLLQRLDGCGSTGSVGAASTTSGASGIGATRVGECSYRYGWVAKLCDFGLSGRLEAGEQQTHLSGPARRSSAYSAPELVRAGRAGPPGDMYAVAVVMWELALGMPLPEALATPQGQRLRAWLAEQATADPAKAGALPPGLLSWPAHTPRAYVELVAECLREAPAERPSAECVCERLEVMVAACRW